MKRMVKYVVLALMIGMMITGCENSNNPVELESPGSLALWVLPDGAVFESATLNIYIAIPSNQTVNVHRVTSAWDEGAVTWNNFGGAYDAAIEDSFECDANDWRSVDLSATVMGWISGDYTDYGVLLDQEIIPYPRGIYHSREAYINEPYLMITYMLNGDSVTEYIIAEADAYISQAEPDINFGFETTLFTGFAADNNLEKQSLLWFDIEGEPEPEGCTGTIGYWKNHAGMKHQADMVTPLLPIWLGDADGDKSLYIDTAEMAVDVLKMKTYGRNSNGVTKLYAQLLGAKLNLANGASGDDVADAIAEVDAFLAMYDWNDWDDLDNDMRGEVIQLKDIFDDYNNGVIGPGHCD